MRSNVGLGEIVSKIMRQYKKNYKTGEIKGDERRGQKERNTRREISEKNIV